MRFASVVVTLALGACAPRPAGDAPAVRCADAPAVAIELRGDLHAIWGDGAPTFHLQWGSRSARVLLDTSSGIPGDSLLSMARRTVLVSGTATRDTATICASRVSLVPPSPP